MSLVAYGNSDSDESEGETIRSSKMNLPLPSIIKSKNGKNVKIAIPSPADFDSDDDEPMKKKQRILIPGRTGLFAVLPAPKNTSNPKSFIPYSISRKSVNSEKDLKPAKNSDDDDDLDENCGPLRFFVADESPSVIHVPPTTVRQTYYQTEPILTLDNEQLAALEQEAIQIQMEEAEEDARRPPIEPDPDVEDEAPTFRYKEEEKPFEMNQEMLHKIQGRKNRGKEEINFIDVSVEQEMPKGNEIKQLTEEAGYQTDKPKGPAPTAQQRRKHQITYLAFQAKERELELKNQWAENRMTRKQTQSKYGF